MEDTLTVTLRKPIGKDGAITTLELREPCLKEFEKFEADMTQQGRIAAMKLVIAKMTKIAVGDLEQLGARDFNKASKFINGFFEEPQETGEPLSQS